MASFINPDYGWLMTENILRQKYAAYLMEHDHEPYPTAVAESQRASTAHICRVLKIQKVGTHAKQG